MSVQGEGSGGVIPEDRLVLQRKLMGHCGAMTSVSEGVAWRNFPGLNADCILHERHREYLEFWAETYLSMAVQCLGFMALEEEEHLRALYRMLLDHWPDEGKPLGERRALAPDLVQQVMERDERTCRDCGSTERLHIDHIIPVSKGGPNILENLQVLCQSCNLSKGARL